MKESRSETLFQEARRYIPGGVNSPVRAFGSVGGTPIFFKQGKGPYLISVDERHYVDYINSWGALILGHAPTPVVSAAQKAVANGSTFGAPTELEVTLAKTICEFVPTIEKVRLVSSGTEATMSAIRLARGYTNRDKIIKFEGCYHGHADTLLVKTGSGGLTFRIPSSQGVPADFVKHTLIATYNDLDSVEQLFKKHPKEIATLIVEPIAGNMNCILPKAGFLKGLRQLCDHYGSLLIFDEVITGFRVGLGGAQQLFNIKPDLTTLGKIMGGGFPIGAFGGKTAIMELVAPMGGVYQAGTLSGNSVAVTAGLATLNEISKPNFYDDLEKKTMVLLNGIKERAAAAKLNITINQIGSMFGLLFTDQPEVGNYTQVMACNTEIFNKFFHELLQHGVYFPPSAFEVCFVSHALQDKEIKHTLSAIEKGFAAVRGLCESAITN